MRTGPPENSPRPVNKTQRATLESAEMSLLPPAPISPTWNFLTESKQGIKLTATTQIEAQGHPSRTEACKKGCQFCFVTSAEVTEAFTRVDSSPTP